MTRKIFKYTIWNAVGRIDIPLPEGAEVLCVQEYNNQPHIWAIVEPNAPPTMRRFEIRATGQELGSVGKYIGTFQIRSGQAQGPLVYHLFESASQ
jgi:hypothetical protein